MVDFQQSKMDEEPIVISTEATASNPGRLDVNPVRWAMHYPQWPLIWASLTAFGVFLALFVSAWFWILALALLWCNYLYWVKVKEHFIHGCVNAAKVVSVKPLLIATATDMRMTAYPEELTAVCVRRERIRKIDGRSPQVGDRVACVALYYGMMGEGQIHWDSFDPRPAETVTSVHTEIFRLIHSIEQEEWDELDRDLAKLPQPIQPGLYKLFEHKNAQPAE